MRLADDRRARVPFALVGVVLLLASAAFAAAVNSRAPANGESHSGATLRQAETAGRTALHAAASHALREAAREPLITPGNTTFGRALDPETPFRDAARLRIYLAAHRAFEDVDARAGDVSASVELPSPDDPESAERAIRQVQIEDAGSETVRVEIRNASAVVRRGGRVVERRAYTPQVTVRTPAFALHRTVQQYQDRLDGGPTSRFGRRFTAGLHAVAWARGYAQYGGAPVDNVVANRHVELLVNGALLAEQRAVFGHADPATGATVARSAAGVGARDLARSVGVSSEQLTDGVLGGADGVDSPQGALPSPGVPSNVRRRTTVGVDDAADAAFESFVDGDPSPFEARLASATGDDDPSDAVEERARRDVAALRDRLREVTVRPRTADLLDAAPADRLADRLRDRRAELISPPGTDDAGPRRAVRSAYFDAVVDHLERRADAGDAVRARLRSELSDAGLSTDDLAPDSLFGSFDGSGTANHTPVTRVRADPAYLNRSHAEPENGTAPPGDRPPLAAENVNWFAPPVADAADGAAEAAVDGENRSVAVREAGRETVAGVVERGLDRAGEAILGDRLDDAVVAVPAGLPITPVPGYWYATANGWDVRATGRYEEFSVSAPASDPTPAENLTYRREAATVAIDADDDGERERLGRNEPVTFTVDTAVVVVVPPGGSGVGDRDGRTERSPGWPPDGTGSGGSSGVVP